MKEGKIMLLVGSPRKKGTSCSFSLSLKGIAEEKGRGADILHIIDFWEGKQETGDISLEDYDTIGLVMPMYVDYIPYPVLWFMEKLYQEKRNELSGKFFFAVCQYGFPHVELGKPTLKSCELYAKVTGMRWLGGLSYGGGAMLDGRPLNQLGKMGEKILAGFKIAMEAILEGKAIPESAQERITLRIPGILHRLLAVYLNTRSRKKAKELGTDIYANPYKA